MRDVNILDKITGTSEKITISTTAIGFTATEIRPTSGNFEGRSCVHAFFVLEGDDIRFRLDGGDPTSALGLILLKGQSLTLKNADDIMRFRAIRVTGDANFYANYSFDGVA